ncbi:MAG: DUF5011 domain-containing protein [Lachnospiraceae bacterium]|nr:DUF5011 domain-containing protein [Lachnospiraceae bacterium]
MRRKHILMMVCAMALCFGCQKAEEKQENNKKAQVENDQKDVSKEKQKEQYSPIISEKEIDMDNEYPYEIKVNRAQNCITVYGADDTGKYVLPVRAMICSAGGEEVPLGSFQIGETSRWRMESNGEFSQYATSIVDEVTFHSSTYHTQNNNDLNVEQFNKMGDPVSGSSIQMETADARWIAENCPEGTKVEIYEDQKEAGPLGKPIARKLEAEASKDPTDKEEETKKEEGYVPVEFTGIEDKTIEASADFDMMEGVTAQDGNKNDLTSKVRVFGQVNLEAPGSYELTYLCKNEENEVRVVKRTIQVSGSGTLEDANSQALNAAVIEASAAAAVPTETPTEPPTAEPPVMAEVPTAEPVPSAAPVPTQEITNTPVPTAEPIQIITETTVQYYDIEAPDIVPIADSIYTPDVRHATLEKRVRVTDNSGSISSLYITVVPLELKPYYLVIYEAEDAAGNTTCMSETVKLMEAAVNN